MRGLFVAEGSSDLPLARLIEEGFAGQQCNVRLTSPDYERLPERVRVDVRSKVAAGMDLMGADGRIDVVVVHRDADRVGLKGRVSEITGAIASLVSPDRCVPVVRMTEAWLLLDEHAIRAVAGNPNGKVPLARTSGQHQISGGAAAG